MPKFTIKMSAKADVFATVEVEATSEEEAVEKALSSGSVSTQTWQHYPGTFIQGTAINESITCELDDPLPMIEEDEPEPSEQ